MKGKTAPKRMQDFTPPLAQVSAGVTKSVDTQDLDPVTVLGQVSAVSAGVTKNAINPLENCEILKNALSTKILPDISADLLPGWLGDYAKEVAKSTKTNQGFATLLALTTMATAMQREFYIEVEDSNHAEELSIWFLGLLASGSNKSGLFRAFLNVIINFEKRMNAEELRQQDNLSNEECKLTRLWTSNTTTEALQELLNEHKSFSILADEAGVLDVVFGLYNNGKSDIDPLLHAYSGSSNKADRIGKHRDLDNPCLSLGMVAQPTMVVTLKNDKKEYLKERGFFARWFYCASDSTVGSRNVRAKFKVGEKVEERFKTNITRLLEISIQNRKNKSPKQIIKMSKEADEIYLDWWEYLEGKQGKGRELHPMVDWTSKAHGAILRVASILHTAELMQGCKIITADQITAKPISKTTMLNALELMKLLLVHAIFIYKQLGFLGENGLSADAEKLLNYMSDEPLRKVFERDVQRKLFRSNKSRTDAALNELETACKISEQKKEEKTNKLYREILPGSFVTPVDTVDTLG